MLNDKCQKEGDRGHPRTREVKLSETRCDFALSILLSPPVNIVCANVHCDNTIAFDIKHGTQIPFKFDRIDRSVVVRGKAVNLVRTETRVERVLLKNLPGSPG